ncbi:MAG: PEGA domain-containing protein [Methanoregula sp.]|nr:PEGA domain-containing protein [Methanoregula sp.]
MFVRYRTLAVAGLILACLILGIAPAAAETSQYRVYSEPSGASFCVDYHCGYSTPDDFPVLGNTWHTITVSMPGYQTWSTYDGVGDSGTEVINAVLVPNPVSYGWLDLNPFEADIYIDDIYYGNGKQTIPLAPGSHTLLLRKAGYYDSTTSFTITAGETFPTAIGMVPYTQSPVYGDLQVQSVPPGAAVYVNENYQGITYPGDPVYVTQLAPGTYIIRLAMQDYQPFTQTTVVQAGITGQITAPMASELRPVPDTTGQLIAGSTPSGAGIYLDTKYSGVTPMVLANIPAGSHMLVLRQTGYAEWTSAVMVTGGSYTEISGTLVPAPLPTKPMSQPTKAGLPVVIPLAGLGICGFVVLLGKKE